MIQTSDMFLAGVSLTVLTVVTGCGVVGAPIAPENVGVNPTIARQKMELKKLGETQEAVNPATSSDQVAAQRLSCRLYEAGHTKTSAPL